jgi:cysteinyl-tRNA synthetase
MNEQLLKDAQRNYSRIIDVYATALHGCTEGQIHDLPMADITSMNPLSKSLGLLEKMAEGFARAMDDDFNSREAVAKVLAATKELQRLLSMELDEGDSRAVANYAKVWLEETAGQILGILPAPEVVLAEPEEDPRRVEIAPKVDELLTQRTEARANKDWPRADAIRDELAELGVVVKDTPDGPTWDFA